MHKILIIGCGGSGKTTLARRVASRLGLPVVHLDLLYWHPGWVNTPRPDWEAIMGDLVSRTEWVMDGNYGGTLARRLAACDTVVFLDLPRRVCMWRIWRRRFAFAGRTRPDLPEGCRERVTWEFIRWVWAYRANVRPRILRQLDAVDGDKRVIILRDEAALERFVATLERSA